MAIATASDIATYTELESSPQGTGAADRASQYLQDGEDYVRDQIGDTQYDDEEAAGSGDAYDRIVKAEALIAAARWLPLAQVGLSDAKAINEQEGTDLQAKRKMTPNDVQQYVLHLENLAYDAIEPLTDDGEADVPPENILWAV